MSEAANAPGSVIPGERCGLGVEELKRRLDGGADLLLLDVRTGADFVGEQEHLAAVRNLPLEDVPGRLEELETYLERPVALICRTYRRSVQAARNLVGAGFADVHVVRGGMTAWLNNGWPVVPQPALEGIPDRSDVS